MEQVFSWQILPYLFQCLVHDGEAVYSDAGIYYIKICNYYFLTPATVRYVEIRYLNPPVPARKTLDVLSFS